MLIALFTYVALSYIIYPFGMLLLGLLVTRVHNNPFQMDAAEYETGWMVAPITMFLLLVAMVISIMQLFYEHYIQRVVLKLHATTLDKVNKKKDEDYNWNSRFLP